MRVGFIFKGGMGLGDEKFSYQHRGYPEFCINGMLNRFNATLQSFNSIVHYSSVQDKTTSTKPRRWDI